MQASPDRIASIPGPRRTQPEKAADWPRFPSELPGLAAFPAFRRPCPTAAAPMPAKDPSSPQPDSGPAPAGLPGRDRPAPGEAGSGSLPGAHDAGTGRAAEPTSVPGGRDRGWVRVAAAALVRATPAGPEVLIARRRPDAVRGDLWEFPGGKIDPGEAPAEAARRELREETGVEVPPGTGTAIAEARREDRSQSRERAVSVTLVWFDAPRDAAPRPIASAECRWERLDALDDYDWPEANAELIAHLRAHARSHGR